MVNNILFSAIALVFLITTLFPHLITGATHLIVEDASLGALDGRMQEDLSSMLRRAPFHEARVFEVARKHILEMESSPACHQVATSTLIDSCQSFSSLPGQDSARTADHSLDEVRQEYAARLAVCELQGIKSGIPKDCAPFVPSREACSKAYTKGFFRRDSVQEGSKRACYPEFTPRQLKQCVDSLFDHGQRWTSYSNAQTNAIVICQASRGAVENEEHLQKLQEALHSHASVSEALSHAVQETEDRLEQHHDFVKAVQQFQDDLAARNEAALANADNLVVRLVGKFDSASEALLGVLTQSFKTANDDAQALQNSIVAANNQVVQARAALQALHDEAISRDGERTVAQDIALKENQALVSDVQFFLENMRDVTVSALAERLQDVESTVIHFLSAQQQALEDQQTFRETQSRIIQNQIIIETSLTSQHDMIEEHNNKIGEMAFSGLGRSIASYTGMALCIILLSRSSMILGAAAATGAGIVGTLGSASFTPSSSMRSVIYMLLEHSILRSMVFLLAVSTAAILIIVIILGGSLLIRNLLVSNSNFGIMLDLEAPKREPSPYV
ncbi:hypothetical protein SLS56_000613 [Neofusicoccum ribis]|uniref:Nuclear membrane fusion protein Kar5 n=1 Tax=Neofusicoccum ribis TaxID=45134 RepID=A0ABR3TD17_9PEZI